MQTFQVVVVALADKPYLDVFSNYYLAQGAEKIRIFFDGDTEYDFGSAKIEVINCDDLFWKEIGIQRPSSVESRQRAIYRYAYAQCKDDWFLIVDTDEFVFGPLRLREYLAKVHGNFQAVRFVSAEATYSSKNIDQPFGGNLYRMPTSKYLSPIISRFLYGRYAKVFVRGLVGHSRGKEALRCAIKNLTIDIHHASIDGTPISELNASKEDEFRMAHFHAINYTDWCQKYQRRLEQRDALEMGKKGDLLLHLFGQCKTDKARRKLFERLYYLPKYKARILKYFGLLTRRGPIIPESSTRLR
jgi:hypothetical protein